MASQIAQALDNAEASAGGPVRIEATEIKPGSLKNRTPAAAPTTTTPQPATIPQAPEPTASEAPTPAPESEAPTPSPEDEAPVPAPEGEAPIPAPEQPTVPPPVNPDLHVGAGPSLADHLSENLKSGAKPEQNFLGQLESTLGMSYQGLKKGLQSTATGMVLRGKMPEDFSSEERQNTAFNIARHIGSFAGDLPLMAASGMIGAAVGGVEGGTVGSIVPGVGTAIGGVSLGAVSGAATAFAVPPAIIKYCNDLYLKGEAKTPSEVAQRIMAQAWETIKGATTGAATAITGGAVGAVSGPLAQFASEVATMTTVSHALEGNLPSPQDYAVNALTIGGVHAMGILQPKLMNMMASTGESPDKVAMEASQDVILKQDLIAGGVNEPEAAQPIDVKQGKPLPDNFSELSPEEQAKAEKESQTQIAPKEVPGEDKTPANEPAPERTDAEKRVMERITDRPESKTPGVSINDMKVALADDLNPLKVLRNAAEENANEKLDPKDDFYVQARLFRDWGGKLQRAIQQDVPLFDNPAESSGEGFMKIAQDIPNGDTNMMDTYLAAKRVLELLKYGKEQGISPEDARAVIEKNKTEFEPIAQRFYDLNKRIKQYAVDAGILDPEKSQKFDEMYDSYVPMYKLLDVDPLTGKTGGKRSIFQAIGSSERQIISPISGMLENMTAIIKASEENRVKQSIVSNPDLLEMGLVRPHEEGTVPGSTISAKFDGEIKRFDVQPEVATAIKAMDYNAQFTSLWAKTFAGAFKGAAYGLRLGIMGDPSFALSHLIRTAHVAEVQSESASYPGEHLLNTMAAMKDILLKNDAYWQFRSSGGATGSLEMARDLIESKPWEHMDDSPMEKLKNFFWPDSDDPFVKKAWNAITTPLDLTATLTHLADIAPRLAEFKALGGQTGEIGEQTRAAYQAREVSVDIAKQGALTKLVSFAQPFLNVDIGGTVKVPEVLKDPKKIAKALALITLPEMVNFALNKDDERYKNTPLWEHGAFMVIPMNNWQKATQAEAAASLPGMSRQLPDGSFEVNNGSTLRIPRPFAMGFLFGSVPHMILDKMANDNPRAFDNLKEQVSKYVFPGGPTTLVQPMLEQVTNHSLFTGHPLVPDRVQGELPQYRYEHYTSEVGKQLGKLFGYLPQIGPDSAPLASPIVVDNYIRAWGGTMGAYAVNYIDKALHAAGIGQVSPEAQKDWDQLPIVRRFFDHFPMTHAQSVDDFRKNYAESTMIEKTLKMHPEEASQILSNNPDYVPKLQAIHDNIRDMGAQIAKINELPSMTPADKRQVMDKITYMIMSQAEEGNKLFYSIKKQVHDNMNKGK